MLYHVLIELNGVGKRNVGQIVSVFERKGIELTGIRKKIIPSRVTHFLNLKPRAIQPQLEELEAMGYYRNKFSELALNRRLTHFFGNHVELFFESGPEFVHSHELWESIRKEVFKNDRKLPIMFVVTTSGENGINIPFIPEDFDLERPYRIDLRTLWPL